MRRFYLDYNATAPLSPAARATFAAALDAADGNPSSLHAAGRRARALLDDARDTFAALLGAKPHEIIFASGGTEANNLAVLGLALARPGRHIVVSPVEHHAVLHACRLLRDRHGFAVDLLPCDAWGRVEPAALEAALRPDTALAAIMSANNETGNLQPVAALADVCRRRGVLLHTDAVQSFGKEPVNVRAWGAASVALAAHKFGGPKGCGILYIQAGTPLAPIGAGGEQESGRRPGTENAAAIAAAAAAAREAASALPREALRQRAMLERLRQLVAHKIPQARFSTHPSDCLPNTLNLSLPGVHGEDLLINCDLEGLEVSSGSACMAGSVQPSHVLKAMGVPGDLAQATVRVSLGPSTQEADLEEIAARLEKAVRNCQSGF